MRQDIKEKIEQIKNGQVPQGYTQTKLGVFPIDWEFLSLKKVVLGNGKYGLNKAAIFNNKDLPKYIRITDISEHGRFLYQGAHVDVKTEDYILKNGDLLFARTGATVGKTYLYDSNDGVLAFAGFLIKFAIKTNQFSPKIIFELCQTRQYWKWVTLMQVRSGQPGINANEFLSFKFYLPQFAEQEKIASVLEEWDKAIELKTSLIDKLKTQKKALMQKLLAPKPDWQQVKLGDILHERNEYMQKGQSLTHVTLSKEGVVDKTERYERDFLVKDEEKKYKITKFNDICYNPANLKFGVICRNNYGSAIFSPIYVTFEVKNDNDPMFVEHFITRKDFINQVRKYEQGTVYERMAVHSNDFLNFKTFIPKPEQQQKIAEVLSMADEQIKLQQKELKQIEKQKKALMQLLLTGIVRI